MSNIPKTRRAVRLPAVIAKVGLSRASIYRLEAEGKFPKRVKLSEHACAWFEDELDTWLAQRAAEREQKEAA